MTRECEYTMTIQCQQLDDLLLDGSPHAMQTAARHAESCAACAEVLLTWNDISETARTMRHSWENATLWPRIDRALRAERRPARAWWLWQVAAGFLLTVAMGATMFYALRVQTHEARFDRDILRISALDEVERAEQAHVRAIEQLESLTANSLQDTASPLMVSYREKLMLLDDAIAECEDNIARNRQNAHLRRQLLTMYSAKQQTLEDVLREDRNVNAR